MNFPESSLLIGALVVLLTALGFVSAINALMSTRTSQGAIAWAIALVTFPLVTLPLYWIFGRDKFRGYIRARRARDRAIADILTELRDTASEFIMEPEARRDACRVFSRLAHMPFTAPNHAELLADGEATFNAIFKAIQEARDYVLVQFFIVRDDDLGAELARHLTEAAGRGVRVYMLFDQIGSYRLSNSYVNQLRRAGVEIHAFRTNKGLTNPLQLNFRNHRKVVLADGVRALVGGFNVGDEYMGRGARFGHWRDTHALFEGPCVQAVQLGFLEDWYWAVGSVPRLNWQPRAAEQSSYPVLVLPTGPADVLDTCNLFFVNAIHAARERVWIVSPYFVPGTEVVSALQLAALRGVDVRIMLPFKPDHKLVYLASFSYLNSLVEGVRFYRYEPGFLHQKVMLVDDDLAAVGTANLDNRSFRLNFEITMVVLDRNFAREMQEMLDNDFRRCRQVTMGEYTRRPLWFKVAVRLARLLSPVL